MLTEHRKKLEKIWEHDHDIERPILDEQQLEILDFKIKEAIKQKNIIKLVYYQKNRIKEITGKLRMEGNVLHVNNKKIFINDIIDIFI